MAIGALTCEPPAVMPLVVPNVETPPIPRWFNCVAILALALLQFGCTYSRTARAEPLEWTRLSEAVDRGDYQKIEAVIVEQGGLVLYEGYFGETTANTRIDARSAGKSITAMAIGAAIDDGSLSGVDSRISDLLANSAGLIEGNDRWRAITIRDVLTMTSALDCDDWNEASPGNEERMYETRDWTQFALSIPVRNDYARGPSGLGPFSYCTAGAFLIGRVVERATGQAFDEYVQVRLFDPAGIEAPIWRRSPTSEVQSGGQLSLRARDFLALGRIVLNEGRIGERQLLPAEWVTEMLTPRTRATGDDEFGYLWWVRDFHSAKHTYRSYFMSGNGGNKVVIIPELDLVAVILSTNYNRTGMHQQTTEILERHILPAIEAG